MAEPSVVFRMTLTVWEVKPSLTTLRFTKPADSDTVYEVVVNPTVTSEGE